MSKFYRINDLAPGLDGLVVEGKFGNDTLGNEWFWVDCIYNTNIILGDRVVKSPVAKNGLIINPVHLEETSDPNREYSTESPFGEYLYEGTFAKDALHITYAVFDNALSVSIFEEKHMGTGTGQKTLYSQNFFANRLLAMELIQSVLTEKLDFEDLIFELKRCKDEEKH